MSEAASIKPAIKDLVQDNAVSKDIVCRSRRLHIPFQALAVFCASADGTMIVAASLLGGSGYQLLVNGSAGRLDQYLAAGILSAVLFGLSGRANGLYHLTEALAVPRARKKVLANWALVTLFLALMAFLFKIGADFSRGSIICFAALALVLLTWGRIGIRRLILLAMARNWVEGRRAVLIGSRDELASLDGAALLQCYGVTEVARVQTPFDRTNGFALSENTQKTLDEALERARRVGANELVLALPWSETRQIELFRETLRASPLPVELLPDRRIRNIAFNKSFSLKPSLSVEVQRAPLSSAERWSKRGLDVVGASIGLLLLAPIMLTAAVAIKLQDPRTPVLFRQRRNGFNTKQFLIFKFRTMRVMEDGPTVLQARRSDPRVTPIGRILRKSSVDELPQLFNVLKGDMSLVGPRPHALAHDSHYSAIVAEYAFRHHVKPGITGWAQVNGYRGETTRVEQMKKRVEYDLRYINNWSFMLDVRILIQTCAEMVRRRNAY